MTKLKGVTVNGITYNINPNRDLLIVKVNERPVKSPVVCVHNITEIRLESNIICTSNGMCSTKDSMSIKTSLDDTWVAVIETTPVSVSGEADDNKTVIQFGDGAVITITRFGDTFSIQKRIPGEEQLVYSFNGN